ANLTLLPSRCINWATLETFLKRSTYIILSASASDTRWLLSNFCIFWSRPQRSAIPRKALPNGAFPLFGAFPTLAAYRISRTGQQPARLLATPPRPPRDAGSGNQNSQNRTFVHIIPRPLGLVNTFVKPFSNSGARRRRKRGAPPSPPLGRATLRASSFAILVLV